MSAAPNRPLTVFIASLFALALTLLFSLSSANQGRPPGPDLSNSPPPSNPAAVVEEAGQTKEKSADTVSIVSGTTPTVKVVTVNSASYQASVEGFGSASAHYQLTLNSRVSGQVNTLHEGFEVGSRVQQGQILLSLENSGYQAALASANLAYQQALREAEQAREEWANSGLQGEPESALVFYEPQLQEALANFEVAKINLQDSQVTAAFNGVITARSVAPGSYITAGSELGEIISSDRVEIAIPLSSAEWSLLPALAANKNEWQVQLTDVETAQHWQGRVLRAEKQLQADTRQRSLIVAVDFPFEQTPALMPGTFVQASIPGVVVPGLLRLPSSSLSQRGKIWFVDGQSTLQNVEARVAFSKGRSIYVYAPQAWRDGSHKVLVSPMNSYVKGTQVVVQEATQDE